MIPHVICKSIDDLPSYWMVTIRFRMENLKVACNNLRLKSIHSVRKLGSKLCILSLFFLVTDNPKHGKECKDRNHPDHSHLRPLPFSSSNSSASCSMIVPPSCSTSMIVTARL